MGNAFKKTELRVSTYEECYRPGEEIRGTVSLYLAKDSPKIQLQFEVFGEESYSIVGNDRYNRTERCFSYQTSLFNSPLSKGSYDFPFLFLLPNSLPSSFSLQTKSFSASITYFLRASIPQISLISHTSVGVMSKDPVEKPAKQEETYQLTCCCFASDFVRVSACLDKGEYYWGDSVLVTIGVDTLGASQGVRAVRLEIMQIVRLRRVNANALYFSNGVMSYNFPKQLQAHTIYTEESAIQVLLSLENSEIAGVTNGFIVESGLRVDIKVVTDSGRELLLTLPLVVRKRTTIRLLKDIYSPATTPVGL